ncbi:MAG: hypothetical protein P0Y58_12415 [Candidatus Pseudomonas phytovorans]|uniref:Uncharacterized protein n=1 Tax=Candidatus Pseudomonas phytovorans TaxID=3121377 RepID=A0AAJ5WLN5_9PSED|nr:hypothetical protein [Pseudomonas sp.]WEK32950.1 MAG: hypothetical protein P0Y58_12415 [Pseudomonas sp.]
MDLLLLQLRFAESMMLTRHVVALKGNAMEIWRQGANRKTGWSIIRSKKAPIFSIEEGAKAGSVVEIVLKSTSDPSQVGVYDHAVRLSFEEVGLLLTELSEHSDPRAQAELAEKLSDYVRPLHRLLNLASGVGILR